MTISFLWNKGFFNHIHNLFMNNFTIEIQNSMKDFEYKLLMSIITFKTNNKNKC